MSIQITSCSSCEINGIRYRIPRATPGASELLKKPLWRENREAADTQAGAKGQSLPANPQASYRVTRRDTSWVIQECRWLSVGPRGRGGEDLGCTPVHITSGIRRRTVGFSHLRASVPSSVRWASSHRTHRAAVQLKQANK